jgi:folate-binding protein YgfZ
MTAKSFVLLEDRAVLEVSGADRRSFLQGLVSNDVEKVGPARALYAALLTAQGKYLHDFFIAEAGDAIWLDGEKERLADLKRRLLVYRLRAKVAPLERPDLAVAAAFGEDALAALAFPEEPGAARPFAAGVAFVDPRLPALGARIIAPRPALRPALLELGLVEADPATYDRHRLLLGVPDGSRDLTIEKSLLLEAGFDELHGIDWEKGCYLGQELTARTKYRGLLKRRLLPVAIAGPPPAPGTPVTLEGREVGEMRSHRDHRGIAFIRIDAALAEKPLHAGEASLLVTRPSWLRLEAPSETS